METRHVASFDLAPEPAAAAGEKHVAPHVIERRHDGIVEYEKD